jgi:ABC-type transporter Mla subunit MlaD
LVREARDEGKTLAVATKERTSVNDQEINQRFEFIINQQAQFAAGLEQLQGLVTSLARVTHAGFTQINEKVTILVDAQVRTEERVSVMTENVSNLAKSQADSDERLNALINVVERYVSGRNGKDT